MNWFNKKNIEKESNIVETPEESKPKTIFSKVGLLFLIWNILSITLYSCYTMFVIYKLSSNSFLSKIIIYLLGIYAAAFVLLVLFSIGNRTKLKYRLKNYKSATNFLKYTIQIINFVLSIVTAISAFITNGTTNIGSLFYAFGSLVITFFLILFEIIKIIIRKNIPLIKRNFLEIREKPVKNKEN